MTAFTPSQRRFAVHVAGLLSLALLAAAAAGFSAARDDAPAPKAPDKPARPAEEEDTTAPPVTHKVAVEEPDEAGPPTAAAPRAVDLAQAAKAATHFAIRKLFYDLAVPHDVLKLDLANHNKQYNIVPYPDYIDDKPEAIVEPFEVTPFSGASWKTEDPKQFKRGAVEFILPYEVIALRTVDDFLKEDYQKAADPKAVLSRYDQDVAAEQALTTVLLHLQSDRQRGARRGDAWQAVEDSLQQRLLGVLLEQLDAKVQAGDWGGAFALSERLAGTYRTAEDQKRIAGPLGVLVKQTMAQSRDDKQKAEARKRLRQLADLFPNNPAVQPAVEALRQQAQSLVAEAQKELDDGKNTGRVGELLAEAEQAWPATPELRTYRLKLSNEHPTLRVGVRELPTRLSPALAATDSDLRAVELLFEGLMKLHTDGAGGGRWEPGLALGRPAMAPRGRQFQLPPNACWSNGERITAVDVRDSVDLIKAGREPDRPAVWGDLLDRVDDVVDPSRVKLTLPQGWLDPLALMNFKVLPAGSDAASAGFAAKPLGSGPFVYAEAVKQDNGRPCVAFTANPYYGARPGKAGLPRIEEIHFIAYKDTAAELQDKPGRLDVVLDLTAKEAAALKAKADAFHVAVTGPTLPNRRIYFLAVNHRKPALANPAFRCALAYAIDRDKLLDDDFRASPGPGVHTALNGPYPVKSWAADPTLVKKHGEQTTPDPFDAELARARKAESGVGEPTLSLKYPAEAGVDKAMHDLAAQVEAALGVALRPESVPADELRRAVEETHAYDLAYYHYDFPDDVYWLGPLLDPRAGVGGENYLGYPGGEKGDLVPMVRDASRRRDFPQLRDWTHTMHDKFLNEEMPFIPLWQLDPLAAVHTDVVPPSADPPFDPLLVFTDVELWKLKRK